MIEASHFEQLLRAAAEQSEPQRLLFVFASAELPDRPTEEQRQRFHDGEGGVLAPVMCVDKAPGDIQDFAALLAESQLAGPPWQVVFAAGLAGTGGKPPSEVEIEPALEKMAHAVRLGGVAGFAAYNPNGDPILFR